jgi:hypothetical protein
MFRAQLEHMLHTIVSFFTRTLVQIAKTMYSNAVRFRFWPRSPLEDEEKVRLLPEGYQEVPQQEGTTMVNPRLRFGFGDYGPHEEEGASQPGNNSLPHDDDDNDQSWHPDDDALTSATYSSSYKARKAGAQHPYRQYPLGPTTASQMANQQGYSRLPNDDDDNRDLANPDQGWNSEDDTLTSAAYSSGDRVTNAPPHDVPDSVQYVSEGEDTNTIMQDDYMPPVIYRPRISRPPIALFRLPEPTMESRSLP